MIALVTGGAGFIGSHLCELLLREGLEVRLVDDFSTGRHSNLATFADNEKLRVIASSILDQEAMDRAMVGVSWVFHLAGVADIVPSIEEPQRYFDVNANGTLHVLESARRAGVKRFVYAASSSCYGIPEQFPTPETAQIGPQYPYALTKYLGEATALHWHKVYGLPVVSLRLFNVYGPRSRTTGAYGAVFGVFMAQKIHGRPLTVVGDGTQTRDFTFVTDVARAFFMAARSQEAGVVMNVGSGTHQSVNRLVELLGGTVTSLPRRPGEPDITFADTSVIRQRLGWQPQVGFEQGVAIMLDHIEDWRDAPVWDSVSISRATQAWFQHLGEEHGR